MDQPTLGRYELVSRPGAATNGPRIGSGPKPSINRPANRPRWFIVRFFVDLSLGICSFVRDARIYESCRQKGSFFWARNKFLLQKDRYPKKESHRIALLKVSLMAREGNGKVCNVCIVLWR